MTIWGILSILAVFIGLCYVIYRTYLNIKTLNEHIEANESRAPKYKPQGEPSDDYIAYIKPDFHPERFEETL